MNLKSNIIIYLCLGPSIISLLMLLSAAFSHLRINWELSHNAGSVCHKLIKVSLSLSLNFMSARPVCLLFPIGLVVLRPRPMGYSLVTTGLVLASS